VLAVVVVVQQLLHVLAEGPERVGEEPQEPGVYGRWGQD
jgi:hypothetical protein